MGGGWVGWGGGGGALSEHARSSIFSRSRNCCVASDADTVLDRLR